MSSQRLQHEIKKKNPFDCPEQEAMLNIWRTNDRLQNRFGKLFRQYGLTQSQYNVLRILRGEGKPLPSTEIANRTIQVVPAITGLLDRLEKANLVIRNRCEEDRRVIFVSLTEKGTRLLADLDQPVIDTHKSLLGHLEPQELETLTRLLEKARAPLSPGHSRPSVEEST